jgi:uncharacterized damage-inducible protein DinB
MNANTTGRRHFLRTAAALTAGLTLFKGLDNSNAHAEEPAKEEGLLMIGPMKGYTPHIGTLVSMLNYNRNTIIRSVKSLTREQIDYLHDSKANSIGALIMHLGATEKFYQINTFEGRQEYNAEEKKIWGAAMELGDKGRAEIKGKDVSYYLEQIAAVRAETLEKLKKKDDKWLLAKDPEWSEPNEPLNTYWKWFHVCEHESNHRGQIAFLKSRLPGAKTGGND